MWPHASCGMVAFPATAASKTPRQRQTGHKSASRTAFQACRRPLPGRFARQKATPRHPQGHLPAATILSPSLSFYLVSDVPDSQVSLVIERSVSHSNEAGSLRKSDKRNSLNATHPSQGISRTPAWQRPDGLSIAALPATHSPSRRGRLVPLRQAPAVRREAYVPDRAGDD